MVRSYRLKDLDCANCAMKIGRAIGALSGVKNAQVHFASQRLTVEFAGEPAMEIETRIRDAVLAIEPDTQVVNWQEQTAGDVIQEEDERRKEFKKAFMAVAAALLLMAAGVLLSSVFPQGETLLLIGA